MISFKWSPLKRYVINIILSYSHLRCWILTLKQQNWKKQRIKFISVVRGKKRFAMVSDLQKEVLWMGDHFEDTLLVFSGGVKGAWCRHFIWPVQDVWSQAFWDRGMERGPALRSWSLGASWHIWQGGEGEGLGLSQQHSTLLTWEGGK